MVCVIMAAFFGTPAIMNATTNILEQLQHATTSEQVTNFLHAQSYSAPVEIGAWLACLAFILFLLNQGGTLVAKLRGKPLPEETGAKIEELGRRLKALEEQNTRRDENDREEHNRLYNKINACAEGVAEIKGILSAWRDKT